MYSKLFIISKNYFIRRFMRAIRKGWGVNPTVSILHTAVTPRLAERQVALTPFVRATLQTPIP